MKCASTARNPAVHGGAGRWSRPTDTACDAGLCIHARRTEAPVPQEGADWVLVSLLVKQLKIVVNVPLSQAYVC